MLEFGKHVGKDIGLFAGFCSYVSEHPEIGINENNINDSLVILENNNTLGKQDRNKVILKNFSGPKFNNILVKNSSSTTANLVNSITTSINKNTTNKAEIGEMTLICLGEQTKEQSLSHNFKNTINSLNLSQSKVPSFH